MGMAVTVSNSDYRDFMKRIREVVEGTWTLKPDRQPDRGSIILFHLRNILTLDTFLVNHHL